jgi:hypothetical protein
MRVQDIVPNCHGDHMWDKGTLIDLGRDKLFTCFVCGAIETTCGKPWRDWLGRRWRSACDAGLVLAFGCLLSGIGLMTLVSWLNGWR